MGMRRDVVLSMETLICATMFFLLLSCGGLETMHVLIMVYMQCASTCALFSPFKFLIILPDVPLFFPASVVRHIYLRPGVGVGALQKVYGGKHSKHVDRVIHTPCVVCTSIAGNL